MVGEAHEMRSAAFSQLVAAPGSLFSNPSHVVASAADIPDEISKPDRSHEVDAVGMTKSCDTASERFRRLRSDDNYVM